MSRDSQKPINLAGMPFFEVSSISINEWHTLPDGMGKPEQVHLWIELEGISAHPAQGRAFCLYGRRVME